MFTNLASSDFLEIFILMLGSFLIGYIFAFYYFKNKLESLNSKFDIQNIDDDIEEIIDGEIKAKKTFDRGGKEVAEIRQKKILFSEITPKEEYDDDEIGEPVLKKKPVKKTKKKD